MKSQTSWLNKNSLLSLLPVCLGLFLIVFRLTSLADWFGVRATWAMVDYKSAIYYSVVSFLSGENPYNAQIFVARYPVEHGFPLYLPITLLIHAPFGLLSFWLSSTAYLVFTLALTFLLGYVSLRFTKQDVRLSAVLLIGGGLLLSRSGHWNALVGQPVLQLVFASYVALYFARHAPLLGGLGLAISLIKPTFGIPLALLLLAQRRVRTVLYGGIMASVMNLPLLMLLVRREGGIGAFSGVLLQNLDVWHEARVVNPVLSIIRVDAIAFLSRFVGSPIGGVAELVVTALILGTAGWLLYRLSCFEDDTYWTLSAGIVCLATLLCIHHQAYDLLLLTLPFVGLVGHRFPDIFYSTFRYRLSVMLLSIPALNYAATHSIMRFVPQGSVLWLVLVSINGMVLLALLGTWVQAAYAALKIPRSLAPAAESALVVPR